MVEAVCVMLRLVPQNEVCPYVEQENWTARDTLCGYIAEGDAKVSLSHSLIHYIYIYDGFIYLWFDPVVAANRGGTGATCNHRGGANRLLGLRASRTPSRRRSRAKPALGWSSSRSLQYGVYCIIYIYIYISIL